MRVPTQLLRARRQKRPVDTDAASLAGCADNAPMTAPKAPLLRVPRDSIEASVRRLDAECDGVLSISPLAADRAPSELKHVGYGDPALVRYRAKNGAERQLVFRTMGANWFGHDRRSDRAALALLSADTYDDIPKHIHVLDVGGIHEDGTLTSLRDTGELYLITTYVEGELYAKDLRRVEETRVAKPTDVARAVALASYLVELHTAPFEGPPELYERAVRDLVGSGEGIFGIADSYPTPGPVSRVRLASIEERCVEWRWRLKAKASRLCRTHGDFHPYNILFREGVDFSVLDASRGCAGDGADDVAALVINFVFGAVVYPGSWREGLAPLWDAFWTTYLAGAGSGVLEVIAPFLAWRSLVVASPVWYPNISNDARHTLLRFAELGLMRSRFDPSDVESFAP